NYLGKSGLPEPDIMLHYNGNCIYTYNDSPSLCFTPRTVRQRSDEKASVDGEEKVPDNGPEPEK
ncbi:hypothetical protein ACIXKS_24945, partial [Bacteroides fragilis]